LLVKPLKFRSLKTQKCSAAKIERFNSKPKTQKLNFRKCSSASGRWSTFSKSITHGLDYRSKPTESW